MSAAEEPNAYRVDSTLIHTERSSTNLVAVIQHRHWWVWMLLGVTFINAGSMIGLTSMDLVVAVQREGQMMALEISVFPDNFPAIPITKSMNNPSFTFDIIMLVTVVLTIVFILRGLIGEKKFEIALYPVVFSVTLIFCAAEFVVNSENQNDFKLARLIIGGILFLLSCPLTALSMLDNLWPEFQIIGASDGLMGMFRKLRYFLALLKFDFYLMLMLAVLNLRTGVNSSSTDLMILTAVAIYAVLFLIIGSEAVKRENKCLVYLFISLALVLPVWIPFQVFFYDCLTSLSQCHKNSLLISAAAVSVGVLGISTRCYILMQLLTVFRHFGYGLTDTAFAGLIAGESTSLLGRPRNGY